MKHANVAFFVPMVGCPHRCSFCDQNSITGENHIITPKEVDDTLKKASRQLRGYKEKTEIAFFGGSFTMIPEDMMISLLESAYKWVKRGAFKGIRLSTRPDAIDEHILSILSQYGVTAIELGAQSSNDEVLKKNLRGHTFEDVKLASTLIKEHGFSLGLQMMTGMPGSDSMKDTKTALDFALLHPDTMRIYPLLTLKNTLVAKWYEEKSYNPPSLSETVSLCADLLDIFDLYKVKVIKLGLHSERSLEDSLVAGPYHPAFHELCESIRFRRKLDPMLTRLQKGNYSLICAQSDVSKCIGHQRSNIEYWQGLGYNIKVSYDNNMSAGDFQIMEDVM